MNLFRRPLFRAFLFANSLALLALIGSWLWMGLAFATTVAILGVLEFTFSFDNAMVNAKILRRMSPFWQKMFLTVGILVAVFFMRLVFPIVLVMATAHLGVEQTFDLALHHPELYAAKLEAAHPAIVGFAATFLMMISLDWLTSAREFYWLSKLERPLLVLGKEDIVNSMITLAVLMGVSLAFVDDPAQMIIPGVFGWLAYQAVALLDKLTEEKADNESIDAVAERSGGKVKLATGVAGFVLFLKIELIDASFSFDGVSGAFAVTSLFLAIMIGLGMGAIYIRSLTVYFTNNDTLKEFVYLEHGAYWAIGTLSVLMFASVAVKIPEVASGGLSVCIIAAAYISSLIYRRRHSEASEQETTPSAEAAPTPASAPLVERV
jgi:hypothetical protein